MKGQEHENKKYCLVDLYEEYGYEEYCVVGYYDTKKELKQAAKEWIKATDGECYLIVGVAKNK